MKNLILLIPLIFVFISVDFSAEEDTSKKIDIIIEKPQLKENVIEIYYFEKMLMKLYSSFQNNNMSFYEFIRQIKNRELKNISILNEVITKYSFNSNRNDFYKEDTNQLYRILENTNKEKKILQYLCVLNNSITYKYSELIKSESQEYNKYSFSKIENQSIDNLLFIDKYIKDSYNMNGCCEVANVLCPIKTLVMIDTVLVDYKGDEVIK